MKQRTFLTTFLLFLIFFNIGILLISIITFKDSLNVIKERSLREHYFITSSIIRDFTAIETRESEIELTLDSIMQPYLHFADNKEVGFVLYKDSVQVFNGMKSLRLNEYTPNSLKDSIRTVSIHKNDNIDMLSVNGKLPDPHSAYSLTYFFDLSQTIKAWNHMKNSLFFIGSIFSFLLALCLILLLNRIFRPLKQISEATKSISTGEYQKRLPITGKDELSEMGRSFNDMADEIQRQIAELSTVAEQKQQFIDNFAHELRTPLTAIFGYAEYMQKTAISEEDKLFATGYIMSESQRMQKLAYQLLELATMRTDEIKYEQVTISELFKFVHSTLLEKATEKQVKLTYSQKIDNLYGEHTLLKSLLINLIENALKACEIGGEISVRAYADDNKSIIDITDNGNGMSQEEVNHSIEPFYRADKARNRNDGGAGLGLSICAQIAKTHNAKLQIFSSQGQGTTVKISFTTS